MGRLCHEGGLKKVRLAGGPPVTLCKLPGIFRSASWGADGAIVFGASGSGFQFEIYVERFPELGDRQRISTSGARVPLWSPDGRELFYLSIDGRQVFGVPIATEARLTAGVPKVLFEGSYVASSGPDRPYRVTPDGKRFVMMKPAPADAEDAAPQQIIVVQNWFEELKRLVGN